MRKTRAVIIITGMHRSGTSLVANLLRHAGVNIGQELIGPDDGNRYGYFEDVDFNEFHERILGRFNQGYLVQNAAALGDLRAKEIKEARQLIRKRRNRKLWGFKDPRTCLFLDFWRGLLPQAGYVFVYRHPLEVVLSLLRRGKHFDAEALARPLTALRSWETHNRALLEFRRRNADRCVLCNISTISADPERFVKLVAKKLAIPLRAEGSRALYRSESLKQLGYTADTTSILNQVAPEATKLFRLLEEDAELPGRTRAKVTRRPISHSRKLKAVVSKLANEDEPQGDRFSRLFSLLLTTVEPEATLAGKEALDRIRRHRIRTLDTEAASREQIVAAQKDQLGRLGDHARNLERRVSAHEEQLAGLTAHAEHLEADAEHLKADAEHLKELAGSQREQPQVASVQAQKSSEIIAGQSRQLQEMADDRKDLRQRLDSKEGQVEEQISRLQQETTRVADLKKWLSRKVEQLQAKTAHAAELQTILAGKEQHLQNLVVHAGNLERVVADQQAHMQAIQERLDAIQRSRVWRLAQRWYAFKFFLGFKPKPRPVDIPVDAPASEEVIASHPPETETSPTGKQEQGLSGPQKVLFISHDARPHGAQILLLHLLKWMKANTDIPFQVLLKEGGSLRPEFEALAPVMVWNEGGSGPNRANGTPLEAHLKRANIGLIYSNTITNGGVINSLAGLNCPVICHVHELEYCLNYQTEQDNNKHIRKLASHYIAVSRAVKQSLRQNLKIRENQIDVVYEFIPTGNGLHRQTNARDRIRRKLKIPSDASVVGGCGTTDWRKGPDLFVQLARLVRERRAGKEVHFVWVGGHSDGPRFAALWHDVKRMNLEDYVHFTGEVTNPLEYFSTFDVFCLTSREDPYPLVNLEVASLGTPIVCFDNSGGAKEFVEEDCGFVVPYLDLEAMAERVSELLSSTELRGRMGERAASKVRERHDLEDTAPQILRIIRGFLSPEQSGRDLTE